MRSIGRHHVPGCIVAVVVGVLTAQVWPEAVSAGDAMAAARGAYLQGRHGDVVVILRAHLSQRPGNASGWAWLGASLSHLGRSAQAVTAFERAYRLAPSFDLALWLGAAYLEAGRTGEARFYLSAVARSGRGPIAAVAARWLRVLQGNTAPALPSGAAPEAYARVVRWYNRSLAPAQVEAIVRSVLFYADRYDVDPRVVMALIAVESGFQPTAQSPAGAYGLGQLMPDTWRALRVHPGDPVANIYATVRVLKGNLERLGGDLVLALAAYNAGRGAVQRYAGIPPYSETQWYVYSVLAVYQHLAGSRSRAERDGREKLRNAHERTSRDMQHNFDASAEDLLTDFRKSV